MTHKKYSNNPEDWFRICDECNEKYMCKDYNSFARYQKIKEEGGSIRCNSCAQTGKLMSEEFREKCRNRIITDEQRKANGDRTRERYANMTEEERAEVSEIQRKASKKGWDKLTPEERKERHEKSMESIRNLPDEKKAEKNKKIGEANKKPDGPIHHPEMWKVNCTECNDEIIFDNYNNFQNTKSSIKKGKRKLCQTCRSKATKRSDFNKEQWVIKCHDQDCSNIIQYENLPAYGQALKRIEEGTPKYCDECRETKHPKKNGINKKYSNDPDDWKIKCKCDDCDKILTYNSYGAYAHNCKRILKGDPPMCYSCAGKHWERTEEYLDKLRGKTHTEESKELMRKRFKEMSNEEYITYCQRQSEYGKQAWDNLSEDQRAERIKKLNALNDISPGERQRINKILSDKAYERIEKYGSKIYWQPAYNIRTIEYIETILNTQFNTIFKHAENGGEFDLFDPIKKVHYFADAYCPILNIWIEFDEDYKFKRNKLLPEHFERHNRILEILECPIIRFRVKQYYKTKVILEINQYQLNENGEY